jgi:hypothetical protein
VTPEQVIALLAVIADLQLKVTALTAEVIRLQQAQPPA